MQLHRLTLKNFRQFRDEAIEFAQDPDQNVTVVHGQNGSGKTTLKNAFTWVLYGDVDFSMRPDKLASQGALAEVESGETVTVEAILEFEHEDVDYELTRRYEYQRQGDTDFEGELVDEDVELRYRTQDGDRGRRDNPRQAIEQILPRRLNNLFFFDGEYITELSEGRSQSEIKEAIQNIMGLTIIERSISHLEAVEQRFERELQEYADTELAALIEERQELQATIEDLKQGLQAKRESRDRLASEIAQIDRKLEGIEDAADLQEERARLETEIDKIEDRIKEINSELEDAMSTKAHLTFAMPAIEATAQDLDSLREQGEIPSEVSNQFVESLLDKGECICGRPLEEGTEHYEAVAGYRSDVTADGFDQAAIRIISHLTTVQDERDEYFETVDDLLEDRTEFRDERTHIEERLDEIGGLLEEMEIADPETGETPAELEAAREEKIAEREDLIQQIGGDETRLEDLEDELENINEQIAEARQEESQAELARKRMRTAEAVRNQLTTSFENLQQKVRDWSDALVEDTFEEIASKDYRAEITDEFELRIRDRMADEYLEVEKSRGERQIASLTFIGSLVQIARERYEASQDMEYFSGGIYPIVMDSPFGALDDEHRRQVSRVIPRMAQQVVVLVTDSQWRGPVANEFENVAGRQYHLEFHPGDRETTYPQTRIVAEARSEVSY